MGDRMQKNIIGEAAGKVWKILGAKEKMQWVKAYKAFVAARDDAERAGIEQQMAFAAQDFSGRWRKQIEGKYTIIKSILDAKQLEEVRKIGKRTPGSLD